MSRVVRMWCLRHAESVNVTSAVAGAVPSAPLTSRGHHQAKEAAELLAAEPISHVYTSTALRSRQTADALTAPATSMSELDEVGIGRHEGTTDPAIRRRTAAVLRAWVVDQDLSQQVGDGETGRQVLARMTKAFDHIIAAHTGGTVALVGHVASLTTALAHLCALGAHVWGTPLPHARPFLVEWNGQEWRCPDWPHS
ncbi:histidine phosphatase family protein [Actinomadura barringtoniae]|uniref:Histidine phosphatase family protein n=1 Tax=Actinomadura barringtoniae TaxID=1427535 RepID=A0A939PKQ0_9ACTN|nr:histidine phosphatase family protein [Actinomadura barringtoniae]MBO2453883.1 histidine phosphatase family protein [Actinomadura barringtoniae]